ncbi:MAG: sigma 54-interacting transcriptional regulator, partial [Planctomycetota bacterium]
GLFERAAGGTVLLDEIGDLPPSIQVKLLRVLEQGEFTRVGDVRPRKSDVRILAATNCDLSDAVMRGDFREDLFHRLSGMQIHLPPLRQRTDDIEALAKHFLSLLGHARSGYSPRELILDSGLLSFLQQQPWHGNVREFRQAIEHAAVLARGRPLTIDDFPPQKPKRGVESKDPTERLESSVEAWMKNKLENAESLSGDLHSELLSAAEPTLFRLVLEFTGGNRAKASELLGIHRGTLRERLRAYHLDGER